MHGRKLLYALALMVGVTACADDGEDADTMPADTAAAMTDAGRDEVRARADQFRQGWSQDDPAVMAAFFAEDAVVNVDTATYTGRQQIQDGWLAPNLAGLTAVEVADEQIEAVGSEYRVHGRYTIVPDTAAPAPEGGTGSLTGRYDGTWARGADGTWQIRAMTITPDAPATTAQ